MPSANNNIYFFLSDFNAFYFSCLIVWLRLPKLRWIKVVIVASLSSSWSWKKSFQLFTIESDISCGFAICCLYVEIHSFYTHSVMFLSLKNIECYHVFSSSIKRIIWFLCFILLMWCMVLIGLWCLNHLCISEMNSIWSWPIIFLRYCWILLANFVDNLCAYVYQEYLPVNSSCNDLGLVLELE